MAKKKKVKEQKAPEEQEMTPYENMVNDRLVLLKTKFEEFPLEEGEDAGTKLPAFIMLHIAQLYTRMDLLLSEIDGLKARESGIPEEVTEDPEFEKAKADAKADIEKELVKV